MGQPRQDLRCELRPDEHSHRLRVRDRIAHFGGQVVRKILCLHGLSQPHLIQLALEIVALPLFQIKEGDSHQLHPIGLM
ncbi:hypothetical protein HRbin14_02133 [bacterium HR14]|nr:hypothetical protein HRbin14_02133 [bacterium HR14]